MRCGERMLTPSRSTNAPSSRMQIFTVSCSCSEIRSAGRCITSVMRHPSISTSSTAEPCVGTEDPATKQSYCRRRRWTMRGAGARIAARLERGNPPVTPASKETGRIEAFSDGVFAIAITLLILDIKVPRASESSVGLGTLLLRQWPAYVAFLASFAKIGIMWINHHRLFTHIVRSSHALLLLNSLLLLGIVVVPFPTALVAEYFGHEGEHLAATLFSGTFLLI